MSRYKKVFEHITDEWIAITCMNNLYGSGNPDYLEAMTLLDQEVDEIWCTMQGTKEDSSKEREELWLEYTSDKISKHITQSFRRLQRMALAYQAQGSKFYQSEELKSSIINGLQWMNNHRYHDHIEKVYDNWWDFNIGGPHALTEALLLMKHEMPEALLESYYKAIQSFNENPKKARSLGDFYIGMNNANLLDKLLVTGYTGLIYESEEHMELASLLMQEPLAYVTTKNGFYEDGSYIDHGAVPYAGGYGGVLIKSFTKLLTIFNNSPWQVPEERLNNVYAWITNAFEPLYYQGAIMDMVSGRGISRYGSNDFHRGKELLHQILALAETASEEKKVAIKRFVKENIIHHAKDNTYYQGGNTNDTIAIKALLADDTIPARGDMKLTKIYGAMDRAVHHRDGFTFGMSMFSSRVSAFEVGNGENLEPWHISDGMVYLYNKDTDHYSKDFWMTIDPMRLPGTTTDGTKRKMIEWYDYCSSKDWVGGSEVLGSYGMVGMAFEMDKEESTLEGKKSWFLSDEGIVALGTDITSQDNNRVETIVENRKIREAGDNVILVNGRTIKDTYKKMKLSKGSWIYLSGNTQDGADSIGYYFFETCHVTIQRDVRTSSLRRINKNNPEGEATQTYVSIAIDHGEHPTEATYAYMVLPNTKPEILAEYKRHNDKIQVLKNTPRVQAVYDIKAGVTGINFWEPSELQGISVSNPLSMTLIEEGNVLHIGVADPTHKQEVLEMILEGQTYEVLEKDETVEVISCEGDIQVRIHTQASLGKSHKLSIKKYS